MCHTETCSRCCAVSFCIFNDALLFCINLVFLKLNTPPALPACMQPLKQKNKKTLLSLYFSYKSTTDTHGNSQFSSPASLAGVRPFRGLHSQCRSLSAKHYAITNGLYRRQEAGAVGPLKAPPTPPPPPLPPLFFFPWIHLRPPMNSGFVTEQAHTHK